MSYLHRLMRQTGTHWVISSRDKFGDITFETPQILEPSEGTGIRWENRTQKFTNKEGEEDHSRAIVYSAETAFAVGDYLYLGISTATNPQTVSGADQVRCVEKCPDTRAGKFLYKALL